MPRRSIAAVGGVALAAIAAVTVAALTFPAAPSVRPGSRPVELPHELEQVVFMACLPGLTSGSSNGGADGAGVRAEQGFLFSSDGSDSSLSVRIEAVGEWSVSVSRAGTNTSSERSGDNPQRISSITEAVTPTARSLYNCMASYRFASRDAQAPSSSSQLLQLYRYDAAILWPCLSSQGIDVGEAPSREQFTDSFSTLTTPPLSAIKLTKKTLPRLIPALQACPLRPDYLG